MSRKKIDRHAESELGKFLDEYFYSKLILAGKLKTFKRITDREKQYQGIDVTATMNNNTLAIIDEKAQLYYMGRRFPTFKNSGLPTFAFELGFIAENGKDTLGWFLNDKLSTNRYFLLWPNATTSCLKHLKKDDFTVVYGMMIKKTELRKHLANLGFDKDYLSTEYNKLRACKSDAIGRQDTEIWGIHFFVSEPSKYPEWPINIVVRKEILFKLATAVYEIRPDVLKRLK